MNLINNTRNQHFISQAEQRLNASNLSAKPQKQRIYKFKVDNRETSCVSLTNRNGVKICNNLSEQDLFSFDVLDEKKDRYNFEELFSQYESQIITHTNSLVSKLILLLPKGPFISRLSSLIDKLTSFGIKIFFLPIFDIKIPYKLFHHRL